MKRTRQQGLTLPELLIALLIFAMISGASVYALRLTVEGRAQLEETDKAIRDMQIARLILKQDLAQVAPRVVRDEFGYAYPAAFLGGGALSFRKPVEGERALMAFVRRGWANPDDKAPRSTLQAVEYLVIGDRLVRRVRPYLDDARGQPRSDRALIAGVTSVSVGFYAGEVSGRLNWADLWPAPGGEGPPDAVRLVLTTERFGELEQLFWVNG
jgi:general secretion pathway protein J